MALSGTKGRKCRSFRRVKSISDFGPAKTRRVCASYSAGKTKWCTFKGKAIVAASCHLTKTAAKRAAVRMRKTCRTRIRIKRVRLKRAT